MSAEAIATELVPVLVLVLIALLELRHALRLHDVRQEAAAWWAQCEAGVQDVRDRVVDLEARLDLGVREDRR